MSGSQPRRQLTFLLFAVFGSLFFAGCGGRSPMFTPSGKQGGQFSVRIAKADAFPGAEELAEPGNPDPPGKKIHVGKESVLTNDDLVGTGILRDPSHEKSWQVELFFTKTGSEKYARLTKENVGNYLAIFLNEKLEIAPKIHSAPKEGTGLITSGFTEAEATSLAKRIVGR